MKKYQVILCDPPWRFATYSEKGLGRSAESYYDCMSLDEIKELPVVDYAAADCVLFLWVTDPFIFIVRDVIEAWGFEPKTVGFYWAKLNKNIIYCCPEDESVWAIGNGYYTRANVETCMIGTRGKPHRINADVRKLIVAPRREHSRKPDEQYDRIERLFPGPYIELFARYQRDGWDTAFSTMEGSVERRWKSNEYPTQTPKKQKEQEPIDLTAFL